MLDVFGMMKAIGRKKVAKECKVNTSTIAQWVYNQAIPKHHMPAVRKLAEDCGVSMDFFEEASNGE